MNYWYRRHVNRWLAVVEADGQHWNYAASLQMRHVTSAGVGDTRADAMRAADALVPAHQCSDELCDGWNEITVTTDVRLLQEEHTTAAAVNVQLRSQW